MVIDKHWQMVLDCLGARHPAMGGRGQTPHRGWHTRARREVQASQGNEVLHIAYIERLNATLRARLASLT